VTGEGGARTPRSALSIRVPAAALTLVATLVTACGPSASTGPTLTVMTRNLYLGTGLTNVIGVRSVAQLEAAVTEDWAHVRANDLATRAGALADEIAAVHPDVVGLQEVTLWREQRPADLEPVPAARTVVLDALGELQHALARRGTPYVAAAISTNADLELPRRDPRGPVDLRITDRDVLLVRADAAGRVGHARHGHYRRTLTLPSLPAPIRNTRGWVSVDLRAGRTTVRIISTHLEIGSPRAAAAVQAGQAEELLDLVATSPHPVIVLADANSPADGSGTSTYGRLSARLHDAWRVAQPVEPGPTCCQGELLEDPTGRESRRIDLVLSTEDWPVDRVSRTGSDPFRAGPPPLWASDHLGVTARYGVG
jgi:endonuclease/exonuclease/phosphatase family metal-dependent hydrolase